MTRSLSEIKDLAATTKKLESANIQYKHYPVEALKLGFKGGCKNTDLRKSVSIQIDGEEYSTTNRFWKSFSSSLGVVDGVFNLFTPEEVMKRVAEREKDNVFRFTTQGDNLVGMGGQGKKYIKYDDIAEWLIANKMEDIQFSHGCVQGYITDEKLMKINGEDFHTRTGFRVPFDGISSASQFASLLRLVCLNGMVGFSRSLSVPHNVSHDNPFLTLNRAISNIQFGEGHELLINKMKEMQVSAISLAEAQFISHGLRKSGYEGHADFFEEIMNVNHYGVESKSMKKERLKSLPCQDRKGKMASVYDALNYITQITSREGSKYFSTKGIHGATMLRAVGNELITKDLDLPDMLENGRDFEGVFGLKLKKE